jgi:hypothetical protein
MDPLANERDDLFRKAGEFYPLRTDQPDWDSLLGKLESYPGEGLPASITSPKQEAKNYRRLFWLMLLIPIGLPYIQNRYPGQAISTRENVASPSTSKLRKTVVADQSNTSQSGQAIKSQVHPNPSPIALSRFSDQAKSGTSTQSVSSAHAFSSEPVNGGDQPITQGIKPGRSSQQLVNRLSDEPSRHKDIMTESGMERALLILNESLTTAVSLRGKDDLTTSAFANRFILGSAPISIHLPAPGPNPDQGGNSQAGKASDAIRRGFYVGLLAAPDISCVNGQAVKASGFGVGLLAGYHLTRNLAIESGVYFDKKYYYTQGKYFNQSKARISSTDTLLNLNGNCAMLEIPLNLNYAFALSKKGHFFIGSGLSTYIMKHEFYTYTATQNGYVWSGNVSYSNSGNYFMSILNVSAGYELLWNKQLNFRIEPYVKVPLNGVGIGNLSISSYGIYFGVIYSFLKHTTDK